eukprot:356202-Pleurochrysis_carterae.AAC.1
MFNDMRWLPFGVTPESNVLVKTAEKGVSAIIPRGKGNQCRRRRRRWRSHRVHQCAAGARPGRQLGFCRAGHGAEQGR